LILRDQARCELLRERWIALMIDEDKLELRAAHIRQTCSLGEREIAQLRMRVIDDIDSDFGGGLGSLAGCRCIARQWPSNADLDRVRSHHRHRGGERDKRRRGSNGIQQTKSQHGFLPVRIDPWIVFRGTTGLGNPALSRYCSITNVISEQSR